jgi:hypothetical protein
VNQTASFLCWGFRETINDLFAAKTKRDKKGANEFSFSFFDLGACRRNRQQCARLGCRDKRVWIEEKEEEEEEEPMASWAILTI